MILLTGTAVGIIPEKVVAFMIRVLLAILVFIIGSWLIKLVRKILKGTLKKTRIELGVIQFVDSFVNIGLYLLLVLGIASKFGLDAASIVAILGSAGVAIGLAIQGSLSNFAGGILILLLHPFRVGDYIKEDTNGNEGTVEEIQLFYTKLKTPDERIIVLPNGNLANNSLTNVTGAENRRLDIYVGISYDSDIKKAKEVLMGVLEKEEAVLKNCEKQVFVEELADSCIRMGVRCHLSHEDYWQAKWRITENIKYALDDAKIEIPYPKLDVYVKER